MKVAWTRLIRFETDDGRVLRGEPILPNPDYDIGKAPAGELEAKVIVGDDIYDTTGKTYVSDEVVKVAKLLGPLAQEDVPIVRCIGLNYQKHIKEVPGRSPPPFPSVFFKANTAINDHGAPIIVPKICQDDQADYEGEFTIVIGKDAKNVSVESALDYVAAYTAGNDVSSRKHQRDPKFAGSVPQWGFSKGFDGYAPIGPALVSPEVLGDPKDLQLRTIVDGEVRQDTPISDLLFDSAYLVSYLSTGTKLQKGSIIMTGTPGGVGASFTPPKWLKPGNVVEVEISKIGTLSNVVEYE